MTGTPQPSAAAKTSRPLAQANGVGLTRRQREALDFVRARIAEGQAPTVRELAAGLDIGVWPAHHRLQALIRRGWLVRLSRQPRALALAEDANRPLTQSGFEIGLSRSCGQAPAAQYRLNLPLSLAQEVVDFSRARRLALDEVLTTAVIAHVRAGRKEAA